MKFGYSEWNYLQRDTHSTSILKDTHMQFVELRNAESLFWKVFGVATNLQITRSALLTALSLLLNIYDVITLHDVMNIYDVIMEFRWDCVWLDLIDNNNDHSVQLTLIYRFRFLPSRHLNILFNSSCKFSALKADFSLNWTAKLSWSCSLEIIS